MTETETTRPPQQTRRGVPARIGLGAVVALAVAAGIVIWLVTRSNGNDSSTNTSAIAVSPAGLKSLALSLRQPIYWVGPRSNDTYEYKRLAKGRILLGYLPPGEKPGTKTLHVIIGTYAIRDAYGATQRAANQPTAVPIKVSRSGAIAFWDKRYDLSAFVAYPGSNYQVEVYDPKPGGAVKLIASGRVRPAPGSPTERTRPAAITAQGLKRLAASLKNPVYWAGPLRKKTYEMAQTSQGWVYVRYLPRGVPVGSVGTAYLTVGTYPFADAFAAVKRLARARGASAIKLPHGGVAAVNPQKFPNSIFVSYPGAKYQVEVFDPSLADARALVSAGKIVAVR